MLKPYHVLGYLVGILVLLGALTFAVQGEYINLFGYKVRYLSLESAFTPNKPVEKKDITQIVQIVDTTMIEEPVADTSIKNDFQSDGRLGAPTGGNLSADAATSLQFGDAGREALIRLFEKLDNIAKGKKVRVLHYGDSQIEGDRMTSYIRQRMQTQFGGFGPGTIPAKNEYSTITFKQTTSANFQRYTCFGGASLKSRRYGTMNTAARFTPEPTDSSALAATSIKEAFIEIEPSGMAYSRARSYNSVRLFYTSCVKPCSVKVYNGTSLVHEDSLVRDGKFHELVLQFPETPKKLRYEFAATVSPTFIGFSLESDYGVFVDNIGMRGSSGTFFGKIDQNTAVKMYDLLNVEMVIMQFGGNSVPYLKDSAGVRNFARNFKGQLNTLKKLRPSATIMVIGPSDMSYQSINGWSTYKMLPYLVHEMTKVTKEVGGTYWDLFSAMGGENSMPSWVDKGLAGKDYIHFSNKGASIASELFFEAFGAAYAKWKQGSL